MVTNNGNTTLSNVDVTDDLISLTCNPTVPAASLAPGDSITCTGTYVVQQGDIDAGTDIMNTATASSDELGDIMDNENVPVTQSNSYTIAKTATDIDGAGNGVIDNAGEEIDYEIVVTNNGNTTLSNVDVTDDLISLTCNPTVPAASLAPGDSITCTDTYVVQQGDIDAGTDIMNTATASSDELGDIMDNENVPVSTSPGLTLEKTSGVSLITNVGQVVNYDFVITNTGNVVITNVTLTDPNLDAPASCNPAQGSSLAPAEVMNCTGQHTVTPADLLELTLENTATADSPDVPPVEDDWDIPLTSRVRRGI